MEYAYAIERVETSNRPLPLSKIKTNTTSGVGVPKMSAVASYYLCLGINEEMDEPQGRLILMGEIPLPQCSCQTAIKIYANVQDRWET